MPKPRKSQPPLQALIPLPVGAPLSDWMWVTIPNPGHPGFGESLLPFWGSEKEAIADYYDRDSWGALGNSLLGATDLIPVKAAADTALKGGFKLASKSWQYQRRLMGKAGLLDKYQHGHHWLIPQSGWGKAIPGQIKNMGWNIKAMESPAAHLKAHGHNLKYGPLQQFFHAAPEGVKRTAGVAAGHVVSREKAERDRRK
jgi:hypothetical protein